MVHSTLRLIYLSVNYAAYLSMSTPRRVRLSAVDERKVATVLFADLTGSTQMADAEDPERVRALLDRFYDAMSAEVEAAGGTVEKFAGDAVMAAFGAPAAYEDHAERALHAALSMHRRLESLFAGRLRLRIGVNTGDVVVGRPREGSSFVSGDAVNVAARLEQAASPGEVLVGERTVAAARGAFEFGEPMTVEAKGKPGGVPCRRLVRALSLVRPRGIQGMHRSFVGREEELDRLMAAYRAVASQGRPRLVTMIGDAGVGKSRLIRELWDRLSDERPEPGRLVGRCLPYGRAITYWPLGEILREHLGIVEGDAPDDVRRRLGDRPILGLTLGLDVAGDLHPLAARDALHEAWIAFFESLVRDRPAVVLIEDLHWAEPPLLDLTEQVVRGVAGPLLLLATARPDFVDARAGWGSGRYDAETIWLEPLGAATAGALVEGLFEGALPSATRDLVVDRAEGNPLFIEELVGSLIDQGLAERRGDRWVVGEVPADLRIPDTVQAVVAARMDLLGPAEKAALQAAAVIGRTFWTGPLYDLVEDQPDLRLLEDRDFIRRRSGSSLEGEREFAFKHAITRDVAYESVPKGRRARLHAAFAEWIEARMGDRDETAATLAHHYAAAVAPDVADLAWSGDPDQLAALSQRAVRWLARAGDLARARYELDEAVALYRQALELRPRPDEEVALWRDIARTHALRFDGMGLWTAMQQAIDRCTDAERLGELYAELAVEAATRSGMWAHLPELSLVQEWIDRALELTRPGTRARAQALVALSYWRPERRSWAIEELNDPTEMAGDPWLRIQSLIAAWIHEAGERRYHEALAICRQAFALEEETSDPFLRAELREAAVTLFTLCGLIEETRRLLAEHNVACERLSPHHRMHGVAMAIELEEIAGDWPAIRALVPRTRMAVAANLATPCVRNSRSLLMGAAACVTAGDDADARGLEAEAAELVTEGYEEILAAPRIRVALARGDLESVRNLLREPRIARGSMWWYPAAVTSYLDGLAALGDRETIERDAPAFLEPPSVLVPFALRALGLVRGDRGLLEGAAERFAAFGLDRQADATRRAAGSLRDAEE
jgi:class 3 adenylate cyclase/tetratricopeptide (TPR) repeat protein